MNHNGRQASPEPRSAIISMVSISSAGIARKMTRR